MFGHCMLCCTLTYAVLTESSFVRRSNKADMQAKMFQNILADALGVGTTKADMQEWSEQMQGLYIVHGRKKGSAVTASLFDRASLV